MQRRGLEWRRRGHQQGGGDTDVPEWRRRGSDEQTTPVAPQHVRRARGRGRPFGRVDGAALHPGETARGSSVPRLSRRGHHRGGPHEGSRGQRRGGTRRGSGCNEDRNSSSQLPVEVGSRMLQELASENGINIIAKLSDEPTLVAFEKLTSEKKMDEAWIRLMVTILAKLCQVEYRPIKVRLFDKICQKQFIDQLLLFITHLTSSANSDANIISEFLSELSVLCCGIVELTPALACETLEIILKRACQEMEELPSFDGSEALKQQFKSTRAALIIEKDKCNNMKNADSVKPVISLSKSPPTDFRQLSHCPTIHDIVVETRLKPYLQPNKVDRTLHGLYQNVDEYLDVHYRLMKEDFDRPLREGIYELRRALEERKKTNSKKTLRFQNIQFYEKVEMQCFEAEKERFGIVLSFDPDKKFSSKIDWEHSKRFMNGSLLVLSEDDEFSSIVLVTVCKRETEYLTNGKVVVELCEGVASKDLLLCTFRMVESPVFFGAYAHVLKALKNFNESSFPLADYIVYGSNAQELPDYLRAPMHPNFMVRLKPLESPSEEETSSENDDDDDYFSQKRLRRALKHVSRTMRTTENHVNVDVNDLSTWPSAEQLGLDESQHQALCGALTSKLMLIQGPPGTGKTFIGLKIASCLIDNQELWRSELHPRPMLIVTYTNHALDQFLKGLRSTTESIVRVGRGCKEPELESRSIHNLRSRDYVSENVYRRLDFEKRKFRDIQNLRDCIQKCSFNLQFGLVSLQTLWSYGIVTDPQYLNLTDIDIFMWLCGFNQNVRLPEDLERFLKSNCIVDTDDMAFQYLGFPKGAIPSITMSMYFVSIKNVLLPLTQNEPENPSEDLKFKMNLFDRVEYLQQELASRHNGLPRQRQPHPAALWQLNRVERIQLYRFWKDTLLTILDGDFESLLDKIDFKLADLAEMIASWKMVADEQIMARHEIVGMTTSFAAKHQQILRVLKPRIVIVEEAAEVLESHVIVSLAGKVEHLIMIGDHKQLRPSPAVYELGIKYHLNVSLFERLIKNGVNYVTLSTQHRMRPEVAKLICPAIYPDLKNHPTVLDFPDVLGIAKNVFFVDHKHPEEFVQNAQSFQNRHEADFLSSLVQYLLLQEYNPQNITVLSTYKGQQYLFSELKKRQRHLGNVPVTTVDNYQGEESDIILLSLVRSNAEDGVGFLKTENRVCVALSRARHGLYIIGNMANMTAADTVWRKVQEELRRQDAIGPALPLRCSSHGVVTPVSKAEDFQSCPWGGCLQVCQTKMPCGHDCKLVCHGGDREHKTTRCMEPCQRPAPNCPQQHPCPALCYVKCPPCQVPKEEELTCGHSTQMPCHVDPEQQKCKTDVGPRTLPKCGHKRDFLCHELDLMDELPCMVPCNARRLCGHKKDVLCYKLDLLDVLPCTVPCASRLRCGHTCRANCHALTDPEHLLMECEEPCSKSRRGCSADPKHPCGLKCHERCEDCNHMVDKTLPCGHFVKMPCRKSAANFVCLQYCEKTLACGHVQRMHCSESAEKFMCRQLCESTLPCGHVQRMPCSESADKFMCRQLCESTLSCGHKCSKICSEPFQPCRVQVVKTVPGCGHDQTMDCGQAPELFQDCGEPCERPLPCGHVCGLECGQDCTTGRCHQLVPFPGTPACGHTISVPCSLKDKYTPSSPDLLALCTHPCPTLLEPCKHQCGGSCGACLQGRFHQPCQSKCERRLLCGHLCQADCCKICPPCTQTCGLKCVHAECTHACGDQCARCKEPCRRRCEHGRCSRRCGDQCTFECSEPCRKKVEECGHDCIGLCGDPCICRECNEEDVTTIFFGTEEDEGARFVLLPDCQHVFESSGLDGRMYGDEKPTKEIKLKVCPRCSTPMLSCHRYNSVMKTIVRDILDVKGQVTDSKKIQLHMDSINENLKNISSVCRSQPSLDRLLSQVIRCQANVQMKIMPRSTTRRPPPPTLSTSEAKNLEQKSRMVKSIDKILRKSVASRLAQLRALRIAGVERPRSHLLTNEESWRKEIKDILQAVELLCSSLSQRDLLCLSEQEAADINLELQRLQRMLQLHQVENGSSFKEMQEADKTKYEEVCKILRRPSPYSMELDRQVQETLLELAVPSSCGDIADLELDPIAAALRSWAGRWFRCPKGHPYCLTEEGGAVQDAVCPVAGCAVDIEKM